MATEPEDDSVRETPTNRGDEERRGFFYHLEASQESKTPKVSQRSINQRRQTMVLNNYTKVKSVKIYSKVKIYQLFEILA